MNSSRIAIVTGSTRPGRNNIAVARWVLELAATRLDFENFSVFRPDPRHDAQVHTMLDQVIAWAGAFKTLRSAQGVEAAQPELADA